MLSVIMCTQGRRKSTKDGTFFICTNVDNII